MSKFEQNHFLKSKERGGENEQNEQEEIREHLKALNENLSKALEEENFSEARSLLSGIKENVDRLDIRKFAEERERILEMEKNLKVELLDMKGEKLDSSDNIAEKTLKKYGSKYNFPGSEYVEYLIANPGETPEEFKVLGKHFFFIGSYDPKWCFEMQHSNSQRDVIRTMWDANKKTLNKYVNFNDTWREDDDRIVAQEKPQEESPEK